MINPKRLILARHRRAFTCKSLAERAGISPLTITRQEKGENQPDNSTIRRVADALAYPIKFFSRDDPEVISVDAISFRSMASRTAKEQNAAIAAGVLGLELNSWIEDRFNLPRVQILDLGYEDNTEVAARTLRQHWGLGEQPISSMIRLLEAHGVRVFSLPVSTAAVDAFSFWSGNKPFIYLNNIKTAERSIFDAAHELGHLVLHKHGGPRPSRSVEREANSFASAFLMPSNDVRSHIHGTISSASVLDAKLRWRVSAMALAHRIHDLRLITDWQYKSICIELGKRGFRSSEPVGVERDESAVWKKIFSQLWLEKTTKEDIADALGLPMDELEGLVGLNCQPDNPEIQYGLRRVK